MKVAVDVYGGDNAPEEIIYGALGALDKRSDFSVVLFGKKRETEEILKLCKYDASRVEVVDADEVITNEESPTAAIRAKRNSSLVKALYYTRDDIDTVGFVSAGSTGAVLAGSTLVIGRLQGVQRPALAPLLPTLDGKNVMLVDCGANVDCKPQMLLQFARMGHAFMESVMKRKTPRIALLSNGTEDKKGNALTHEAFTLLKDAGELNFVGNTEARDILSGEFDVVVADGFDGNVALKSCEGTAVMMLKLVKREVTKGFIRKLAAGVLKPAFASVRNLMDYNKSGGAPFLGLNKIVVKSHGASKAPAITGSILQVLDFADGNLIEKMRPYFALSE